MLKVGLTGGTGAGKSTVASRLADHGAVVIDADKLAREVIAPGTEGLRAVVEEFGVGVLGGDGALDRPALAALVFADPGRRRALEEITHPRIAALTAKILLDAPDDRVVVHDVPLLVEKRMGAGYHLVLVTDAPASVRVSRLVRSRGMAEDDARARVRAQASDVERRAAADVVLDNSGPPEVLLGAADELWHRRLVPFERNVRENEPAPRAAVVRLTPYDPTWPAQARRLIERVRVSAGRRALGIEHIGSTAVPGLAAKDVIDLQLRVSSLAVADELQHTLEAVGYARLPGEWWDDEPSGTPPKRIFCSCDPGRAVNLHVRAPGWTVRKTMLFRDWLSAHDDERSAYAEVKARLQGQPVNPYAEAKGPWIRAAYERADAWAEQTGWSFAG